MIVNVLVVALNPNWSCAVTVNVYDLSSVVVPPSNVNAPVFLSIVVRPGLPTSPNCLTFPCNCPSMANVIPGGNLPESNEYTKIALGTVLVAFTDKVDIKFALKFPRSLAVFHVITLSTSPSNLTVKVLSLLMT